MAVDGKKKFNIDIVNDFYKPGIFDQKFNGDTKLHGKYYPDYKNAIEGPKNLLSHKVDELWLMALDYDEEITNYLRNELKIPNIEIFSFKKFLEKQTAESSC